MLTMRRLTNTDIVKQLSVIIFFIITSLLFFSPVLKGKKILQNDIVQYSGMSKELKDFRDKNDEETYWVNNAFSGMPTYQLGAKYPHNYIKQLDLLIRFLPRPAKQCDQNNPQLGYVLKIEFRFHILKIQKVILDFDY